MQMQLRDISEKAKCQSEYRFLNLYTMLNESNLKDSWRYLNKNSAMGTDRISAREYEQNLESNIQGLVARLKKKSYRSGLKSYWWKTTITQMQTAYQFLLQH